jgi:hypothetical protein
MAILGFITEISMTFIFSYLFIEVERLPFPMAAIDSSIIITLTTKEERMMKFFLSSFFFGLIYGILLYFGLATGVSLIPLPWVDLMHYTEKVLPGAIIGVSTDPSFFALGFILPLSTTISVLLGSALIWIFGNTVFLLFFPEIFPEWAAEYFHGMTIGVTMMRSQYRVWLSMQIGIVIGLATVLFIKTCKSIVRVAKTRMRFLGLFFLGTIGSVILYHFLVPEIPIYVPLLSSVGLSFLFGIAVTRSIGELGFGPTLTWPWQAIIYLTPYTGYAGWVYSPVISLGYCGSMVNAVKVAYLTETRPIDYFKGLSIAFILNYLVGFISLDFFWKIAPIPSSVYPYTQSFWPTWAIIDCLFATRQIRILPTIILGSAGFSAILFLLSGLMLRIGTIFSPVAFLMGFFQIPPYAITMVLGSFVGNFLSKHISTWQQMRGTVAVGFLSGIAASVGFFVIALFMSRAAWIWPW